MSACVQPALTINEVFTLSRAMLAGLLDTRTDIDKECGYPPALSADSFQKMYDREGLATRVVDVFPEESWSVDPEIYETEDARETAFEKAFTELRDRLSLYHFLHRIDELSGIGRFGVMLLGFDDGKEAYLPVTGTKNALLYLRTFAESAVQISRLESDSHNPRFGQPVSYAITFQDQLANGATTSITQEVHWTRVIHVADNRKMSEVYGTPRMQKVFNRLYDLRKILSGSGEMFWKGAFPGFGLSVTPENTGAVVNEESIRKVMEQYQNGLQRYIALSGMKVESLATQLVDPTGHMEAQLRAIAIALGVPTRILFGSEQAQLASQQDSGTWNKRIHKRQTKYLTPMVIRPLMDRLILFGTLPQPKEGYFVEWPDLNTLTDQDKADVAAKVCEALAKYVSGNVATVIPPKEFLTHIMKMPMDVVDTIIEAGMLYADDMDAEDDHLHGDADDDAEADDEDGDPADA